jgi:parvulin-like peptidyl-prolyl isomerase
MKLFYKIMNYLKTEILFLFLLFMGNLLNTSFCANSGNDTLAVIGTKAITVENFLKSYKDKLTRIGITDNGETRKGYLMNLVSDELLIAEAKVKGLDETVSAKIEYKRIKLQELLNAYTLKHISPLINVTDVDLKELFIKLNTKIKVSHLYAPTKEKADHLYNELIEGKKFEDITKENFKDPGLRNNGGSLGYISIDEMDPDFEEAAYSMKPGEISKPVKTVQGYSIIRVEDIKGNPLLTENEYLKAYDKLKAFARKRAFEEASKNYSKSLREKLDTKFDDALISKIFLSIQDNPLKNFIENPSVISSADLNKIIVTSAIGKWSLQTLIDEMSIVTQKQKKLIKTRENLEDFIAGIVNRKYIEKKALEEKLDKIPTYRQNVEYNFDTYLLTTIEDELKSQIKIPEDSVKAYYISNIYLFMTEPEVRLSSILLDGASSADSIKNLLENGAEFEELAKKYSIQTFTAEKGGDMGFFKKEDLDNLADEIFDLKIGQWTGPFIDVDKYAFIKCTDFKMPVTKSYEESKKEIEEMLTSFEWLKVREQYVDSLKKKIHLEIYPEKLYDLLLTTKN